MVVGTLILANATFNYQTHILREFCFASFEVKLEREGYFALKIRHGGHQLTYLRPIAIFKVLTQILDLVLGLPELVDESTEDFLRRVCHFGVATDARC